MMTRKISLLALALLVMSSCASRRSALTKASESIPDAPPEPTPVSESSPSSSAAPTEPNVTPAPTRPTPKPQTGPSPSPAASPAPAPERTQDDPKISRSAGEPGGVVVLWPRVIPSDITDMNRRLIQEVQTHLRVLAARALPGRPLDVRPEPERVCRRSGCEATSVNVLFTRHGDGCAVVALVTPPGPVETTLLPWAGNVELTRTTLPFREPPESHLRVKDLARCTDLLEVMRQNDAPIEAAIRAAAPSGS